MKHFYKRNKMIVQNIILKMTNFISKSVNSRHQRSCCSVHYFGIVSAAADRLSFTSITGVDIVLLFPGISSDKAAWVSDSCGSDLQVVSRDTLSWGLAPSPGRAGSEHCGTRAVSRPTGEWCAPGMGRPAPWTPPSGSSTPYPWAESPPPSGPQWRSESRKKIF